MIKSIIPFNRFTTTLAPILWLKNLKNEENRGVIELLENTTGGEKRLNGNSIISNDILEFLKKKMKHPI